MADAPLQYRLFQPKVQGTSSEPDDAQCQISLDKASVSPTNLSWEAATLLFHQ